MKEAIEKPEARSAEDFTDVIEYLWNHADLTGDSANIWIRIINDLKNSDISKATEIFNLLEELKTMGIGDVKNIRNMELIRMRGEIGKRIYQIVYES